ncbi:substrate-binding periplasmic protein [Alteromonas gilva]|uniref:Transporter substrate-binding domain-containing protein n=1 Tax=Alteromonas gilva TaxID=2987522 RepID=A0ABT5L435_9ALTE|nr:transporter substrate-binding domain-containing protein [Alteromonas gilva]MDC8831800.1 transporter substrate-binding domain-containing protein [Alteromonas gilva]
MKLLLVIALSLVGFSASVAGAPQLLIYTENSPPYQFVSDDKVQGLATQKVQEIVKRAGFTATFTVYPWARALRQVEQSPKGLIYSIAKTPERDQQFVWIAPVAAFELGVLSLKSASPERFSLPLDPHALSVAAQRGDIAAEWLLKQGFVEGDNLILCADILCSWHQLKRGTVDFIIEDPNLIDETAALVGLTGADVMLQQVIPALSVTGYLAANNAMDADSVARLRQAAHALGYHEER